MSNGPINVRRISTARDFRELQPDWESLHARSPQAGIFQTWAWLDSWLAHFPASPLILLAYRETELIGALPLMIEKLQGVRKLRLLGCGLTQPDHLDLLASTADAPAVASAFAQNLHAEGGPWQVIHFEGLAESSLLPAQISACFGAAHERPATVCPYMQLDDVKDWDDFQKQRLSSHMRSKGLRYLQNLLERNHPGEVIYEQIGDEAGIAEAMEALISQHRDRWAEKQTYTPFEEDHFLDFHRQFAQTAHAHGWLGLYRLRVAGHTIASVYGFHFRNRFYDYQHALDDRWSKYSPGRQLISYIVRDCLHKGRAEYDFLCGTEKYKYSWTSSERHDRNLVWSASLPGWVWKQLLAWRDRKKQAARPDEDKAEA